MTAIPESRPGVSKLAAGNWIDAHDNLILCGETGLGKSWLACALGREACRTTARCSISVYPNCSASSRSPAATAATPASSGR